MTFSDSLLDTIGDMYISDAEARLAELITRFEMVPDVRSKIEKEFWKREARKRSSVYRVLMSKINAYSRIVENIQFGLKHQGNITIELVGRKRHGKSTVARWLARERWKQITGTIKGWEEKVIYDQSYSGATNKIKALANQHWQDVCEAHTENVDRLRAFFERMQFYLVMQDENWIEHEKDSKKAENDLKNLVRTCAVTQIDFFFISTVERINEVDFKLWVLGIDSQQQQNLSLYFDVEQECHGYLITPNIPETKRYWSAKAEGVLEMLLHGGRRIAEAKLTTEEPESETEFVVPLNVDLFSALRIITKEKVLQLTKRKERRVNWFILRHFEGKSDTEIKEYYEEEYGETFTVRAVGRGITAVEKDFNKHLPTMKRGILLEEILPPILNKLTLSTNGTPTNIEQEHPTGTTNQKLVRDFRWRRRGVPGAPDVVLWDPRRDRVVAAVSCKFYLSGEQQNIFDCAPEYTACPDHAYLFCIEHPEGWRHRSQSFRQLISPIHDPKPSRVSLTNMEWDAWLEELRLLTLQEVNPDGEKEAEV